MATKAHMIAKHYERARRYGRVGCPAHPESTAQKPCADVVRAVKVAKRKERERN